MPFIPDEPKIAEKRNIAQKIGGFLGIEEFGQRLGAELVRFTPEWKDLQSMKKKGLISEQAIKDITTAGISDKEAIASFGLLALNLAAPGLVGGATKLGLRGTAAALKAGQVGRVLATPTAKMAGLGAAFGAAEAIKEDRPILGTAATTAGISAALPVVGRGLLKGASIAVKNIASILSGTPKSVINYAIKNPGFGRGMREAIKNPSSINKVIRASETAFSNIRKQKTSLFKEGFDNIVRKYKSKIVNVESALNKFSDKLDDIGIYKTEKGFDFSASPLDEAEEKLIRRVINLINKNKQIGFKAANNLKRKVRTFYSTRRTDTYNSLITDLGKRIDDEIISVAPEMKLLNRKYAEAAEFAKLLQKEFKVGLQSGRPSQSIRALRNAFRDNNEVSLALLKEMESVGGSEILDLLAGHYFTEIFPSGILAKVLSTVVFGASGFAAPTLIAAAPLASPRAVGAGARAVGNLQRVATQMVETGTLPKGLGRTQLMNLIRQFGEI